MLKWGMVVQFSSQFIAPLVLPPPPAKQQAILQVTQGKRGGGERQLHQGNPKGHERKENGKSLYYMWKE